MTSTHSTRSIYSKHFLLHGEDTTRKNESIANLYQLLY